MNQSKLSFRLLDNKFSVDKGQRSSKAARFNFWRTGWKSNYDRRSVSQSVLTSDSHLWSLARYLLLSDCCGFCRWGAFSDERTGLSFANTAGPRQRSHLGAESNRTLDHTLMFHISESPTWRARSPHFISPMNRVGQSYSNMKTIYKNSVCTWQETLHVYAAKASEQILFNEEYSVFVVRNLYTYYGQNISVSECISRFWI
jgi:hypothetical protein